MDLRPGRDVSWPMVSVGIILAVALGVAASLWHRRAAERESAAQAALASLRVELAAAPAAAAVREHIGDFVQKLPAAAFIDPVVRDLQRFSASAGVAFVSIDATPREPTVHSLGRVEAVVTLRGGYAGLKSVLSQVLDRHANLVVQRLSLRRLSGPGDVEVSVGLVQLTRPLPGERR